MDKENSVQNASKKELIRFMEWVKKKQLPEPILIGGWAVYAYVKDEMSIDIDIVFESEKDVDKIMGTFFKENGYTEIKDNGEKRFVKRVGKDEIKFDCFNFQQKNKLMKNSDVDISWHLLKGNSVAKEINGITVKVPAIELLMIYKAKAYLDRDFELNMRGISISVEQKDWLKGKLQKDARDMKALQSTNLIDKNKLEKLLKKCNFGEYYNWALRDIKLKP